ncbi:unnamed protein product [Owenia fusiformis]|uniref:Uncharacterized protein n=1 Tax=Owenia fusiformis TaxID=6347 RepID=A0A8S4NQ68_OWEFU|nr:unnamed protein product [Owenia fusiformis]
MSTLSWLEQPIRHCQFNPLHKRLTYLLSSKMAHNLNSMTLPRAFLTELQPGTILIVVTLFLEKDKVEQWYIVDEQYLSRYQLQDAWYSKVKKGVFSKHCTENLADEDGDVCKTCFKEDEPEELSSKSFDVKKEWCFGTPLDVQLLFNEFLNKESLRRAPNREIMCHGKLERLYATYDTLLNIFNKKYMGLLQQEVSDDLLMNYSSLPSVSYATSRLGLTYSFDKAEKSNLTRHILGSFELVEEMTAVDDRRHTTTCHLSKWISMGDLIQQAELRCPAGTPIPSSALVRLQFTPRNPYTHQATTFTKKLPIQYKIQRRQLRASHEDAHFCAAQFKYMREKSIEMTKNGICVDFHSADDKAKIPVGDPDLCISTGVRGKKTISHIDKQHEAADHDMSKNSITPNVLLQIDVPNL